MGKAVPALTHRGFVTNGLPAHYSATWGRVRLRAGRGLRRSARRQPPAGPLSSSRAVGTTGGWMQGEALPGFQQATLPARQQLGKISCWLRILLRTVKEAQNLDSLFLRPHAVNENKRRPIDNQFPRAAPASDAADFGVIRQHVALLLDLPELVERRARILFRDIVDGMGAIGPRSR